MAMSKEDRNTTVEFYINVYKSYNGMKPRWIDFDSMTDDELDNATNVLLKSVSWEERVELEHKKAVLAAMDNPNAIVAVSDDPWMLDDEFETVDDVIRKGDFWKLEVYVNPDPESTIGEILFGKK